MQQNNGLAASEDSMTRRGFIKVAGIGGLGMVYAVPHIDTLQSTGDVKKYGSSLSDPSSPSSKYGSAGMHSAAV